MTDRNDHSPVPSATINTDRHRLNQLIRQFPDGDIKRLLNFAEAMARQEAGKRESRSVAMESRLDKLKPGVDDWQIGQ